MVNKFLARINITMAQFNQFNLQSEGAIPYYYEKSSTAIIPLGPVMGADELDAVAGYATSNKNALNLQVPMLDQLSFNKTQAPKVYHWPLPFFFNNPEYYEQYSAPGVTVWRNAQTFWANIAGQKPGMSVFAADLYLVPEGLATDRLPDNPGGPSSLKWFTGGSCRITVVCQGAESLEFEYGDMTQKFQNRYAYEVNNKMIHQARNTGSGDAVFLDIDLCPTEKMAELEQRILADATLAELHVQKCAGYPAHTTVFL